MTRASPLPDEVETLKSMLLSQDAALRERDAQVLQLQETVDSRQEGRADSRSFACSCRQESRAQRGGPDFALQLIVLGARKVFDPSVRPVHRALLRRFLRHESRTHQT